MPAEEGAVRLLTATLRIYIDAAREAGKAFARSAWALVALLVCFPLLTAAGILVAPLGLGGGLIMAFLQAVAAGTYLSLLYSALTSRQNMSPAMLRSKLGAHTWDVMNVLFPLWILDLVLGVVQAPWVVTLVVGIAVFLFCNPVPEMIGRARSGGVELLQEAGQFMLKNGPEWIVPQVVVLGLAWLVIPDRALDLLQLFGPRMGFVGAGALAFSGQGGGPVQWAVGFGLVALVHLGMLFRGALYERLSRGGRRGREWESRFR